MIKLNVNKDVIQTIFNFCKNQKRCIYCPFKDQNIYGCMLNKPLVSWKYEEVCEDEI